MTDETEHLLSSPANAARLREAVKQVAPLSCNDAWYAFSDAEELINGSPSGNWMDDMRMAFEAGWAAATAARP